MLNQAELILLVEQGKIEWSAHTLRRMLERNISRESILHIICHGEIIESYPDDRPFPSALFFGMWDNEPLHTVIAHNNGKETIFVITAYQPDTEHFDSNFRTRKINDG